MVASMDSHSNEPGATPIRYFLFSQKHRICDIGLLDFGLLGFSIRSLLDFGWDFLTFLLSFFFWGGAFRLLDLWTLGVWDFWSDGLWGFVTLGLWDFQ